MGNAFKQNKKGMALALVLVVMAVVSILGLLILQTTVAETKFAARDENRMKAYYLARSGVESTVAWMLNPVNYGSNVIDKTSSPAVLPGVSSGSFTVAVTSKSATQLLVTGTGTVNGVTASAAMKVKKASVNSSDTIFDCTIYAADRIEVGGSTTIEGTVGVGDAAIVVFNGGGSGSEEAFLGSLQHPSIVAPVVNVTIPAAAPDMTDHGNGTLQWDLTNPTFAPAQTLTFDELDLSNKDLTILTGSAGNVVNLVVDDLKIIGNSENLNVIGDGRLDIYVKTSAQISININTSTPINPGRVCIKLAEGSSATLDANRTINALVYGPGAKVTINGTNGFTGAVLAGDVTCSGTSDIRDGRALTGPITYHDLGIVLFARDEWVNP